MPFQDKCDLLAAEIKRVLARGITLSREVVDYIDSTFSNPSISELQDILQDDTDCEKDSLEDLLFFPDEATQAQLEAFLENYTYAKEEEIKVASRLCRSPFSINIYFPDDRGSLKLEMPDTACEQLVSRLNISRHADRRLVASVNQHINTELQEVVKVKLRNSRFVPTEKKIAFLCSLFEKLDSLNLDFLKCLSFALEFVEELSEQTDIFQTLMIRKRFYLKNLKKTEQFEAQFQKSNMETLLMQGKRASYFDKADAREKMLIIDKISRAVFGRTEFYDLAPAQQELVELHSTDDIEKVMKILG